jgi:pimeloyl-ACP methyl ester carboxylesterase
VSIVTEHIDQIGELPVFWRSAPPAAGQQTRAPILYLHGAPSNSDEWVAPRERPRTPPRWRRWWRRKRSTDDWVERPIYEAGFLERSGGLAVDLPGFGRSGKPGSRAYTIDEYADFLESFLELVGVERVSLVMHDWGVFGLAFAQAHPERVERLVLINAVPFLPGYRWHRVARLWRIPVLGELLMGSTTRTAFSYASREANVTEGAMPGLFIDSVIDHFDQGTQRAMLRLYRSSPPEVLAKAGERLGGLSMPSFIVWGEDDPYIPERFAAEYAHALGGNAQLLKVPAAGHWPWLDQPEVIDRVLEFLAQDDPAHQG